MTAVFKIIPTIQQYDWGKTGKTSKVAQFATTSQVPGFELDEEKPYAELWMGTHVKSPSRVLSTNELLSDYLAKHPELIGKTVIDKFDAGQGHLPFLFKVLSIQKALSIQSHPDKHTAELLHAEHPDIYKDPNHKPEMALALTPFEALCGFLPLPAIASALESTPELRSLIDASIVDKFITASKSSTPEGSEEKAALKELFAALMNAESSQVKTQLDSLLTRYRAGETNEGEDGYLVKLIMTLNDQFPGDIGIFCAFFLNYIHLATGEAISLGAGEPHAYLSGDCVECMANSDNVIRAGLTPKLRDIPALVDGLTYIAGPATKHYVKSVPFSLTPRTAPNDVTPRKSHLYDPPISEFSVVHTRLNNTQTTKCPVIRGPSIAIVTLGSGKVKWNKGTESLEVGLGDVFFIGADTDIELLNFTSPEFVLHRAFVEAD